MDHTQRQRSCSRLKTIGLGAAFALCAASGSGTRPADADSLGAVPVNHVSDTGQTTRILNPGAISWVHFGDLHITSGDQQNYADFKTIINSTNQYLLNGVNFAFLPGDNANEGSAAEYQLIKAATDGLKVPLYAVPGDHDHHGLANYTKYMEARPYYSFSAAGYHFAFLDVMAGIDSDQRTWLTYDLAKAKAAGLKSVLFAHTYNIASDLTDVIQHDNVIMVDAGHTHTNNVANDGNTIYAATRSTGQISEGPVGFTLVNLDNGVVSWKFKPLGSWPFVMITSPSDKGLMIDNRQAVSGTANVRAKVWDDKGVSSVTLQVDGGTAQGIQRIGSTQMWSAPYNFSNASMGDHKIRVNVQGAGGNTSSDAILVAVDKNGATGQQAARTFGPSSNSLGVYTEKGLLGNTGGPGGGRGSGGPGGPGGRRGPSGPGGPGGAGGAGGLGADGRGAAPQSGGGPGPAGGPHGPKGRRGAPCPPPRAATPVTGSAAPLAGNGALPPPGGPGCGPGGSRGTPGGPQAGGPAAGGGPRGRPAIATLMTVNGTRLTVRLANGTTRSVVYDANTRFIKEINGVDQPAAFSELRAGQTLELTLQPPDVATSASQDANALQASAVEITRSPS